MNEKVSQITTSEKRIGFLLIETFSKTKQWSLGSIPGGHFTIYQRQ